MRAPDSPKGSAMAPKIFIDGEVGTTGLQIRQRLLGRRDIELISIDPARRKEVSARKEIINRADVVILCLPDDAAREAVSFIENERTRVIDASTAYRTAQGWAYGFPELTRTQRAAIACARSLSGELRTVPSWQFTGSTSDYPFVGRTAQTAKRQSDQNDCGTR